VEKRHARGTGIKAVVVGPPRLPWTAGHVKHRGCLARGDSQAMQLAIPCKEVRAFEASPTLVAILIAMVRGVDYRCQSYLPTAAPTMCEVEGSGWRGSSLVAIPSVSRHAFFRSSSR
jgi:hypothetical protein